MVAVTYPGGYGVKRADGRILPTMTSAAQADSFIRDRIREGSDFIKILLDTRLGTPTLDRDTFTAVVNAAHKYKKLAIVHAPQPIYAQWASEAGVAGLAHFYSPDPSGPELTQLLRQHGLFIISTLMVLELGYGLAGDRSIALDERLTKYISPSALEDLRQPPSPSAPAPETAKQRYRAVEKALYDAYSAGVPILAGTDNHGDGASLHRELELLVHAGIKPVDVLRSATSVAAKQLRLGDRGRIAVGARADLLLVEGDPGTDITNTRNIAAVWKQGRRIAR